MTPFEIAVTNELSTFPEAVPTHQVGLSNWTTDDANLCRDLATILPFIVEPGYCAEITTICCTLTITSSLEIEREIPEACKMCRDGSILLSNKLHPGHTVCKSK
jgi:hypothetical protein